MKKLINPKFEHLSASLESFSNPAYFERNGELLHEGRNVIKRFRLEGTDVVVKRYGHFTCFNRLMYSTFRKSKAERAFLYACRMKALGVSTPDEIAVLETFRYGVLQETYFVSACSECQSLAFLHDFTFEWVHVHPLLNALASWLAEVHDKGILHQDLNVGNILYEELPDGQFSFQLIDNNRMKFCKHLALDVRLKNLCKLSPNFELHHYVLNRYLQELGYDSLDMEMKGCFDKMKVEYRQLGKQRMKHLIKR